MAKISRKERNRLMRQQQAVARGHVRSLEYQAAKSVALCGWCGEVMPGRDRPEMGGRRRVFCSDSCRLAKWRFERRRGAGVCESCGGWRVILPDGRSGHVVFDVDGEPCPTLQHRRPRPVHVLLSPEPAVGLRDDQLVDLGEPLEVVESLPLD